MKVLKIGAVAALSLTFLTGCGESNEEESTTKKLTCTYRSEMLNTDNEVILEFESDKIISSQLYFRSDTGFDQDYANAVCESYELNEGIACSAVVISENEDEVRTVYEITGNNDEGTRSLLSFREMVEGETLDEMKASFEDIGYTCE